MTDVAAPKFGQKFGTGAAVRRKEDAAFIQGKGCYTDDISVEGEVHAVVVRSAMPHARFTIENKDEVAQMEGVALVLTHDDISQYGSLRCSAPKWTDENGDEYQHPPRYMLSKDVARYVGDPLAFVVADTRSNATLAAEALWIDYDSLPTVVGVENAAAEDAALVWPEKAGNLVNSNKIGDKEELNAIMDSAAHVTELRIVNNRLVCNYMETRGCIAEYNADDGYKITYGTQGVHGEQRQLCDNILNISKDEMRVVTPDVGGGFGTKAFMSHEYPLCCVAAKALGKPVRWMSSRTEHFLADVHGRDTVAYARLALDADHNFIGLDIEILADMGAYLSGYSTFIQWFCATMATGVYDIPALHVSLRNYFTNTTPTDAYRGAGRPEAAYMIERLVDAAAKDLGVSSTDLRTQNFIPEEAFPYTTQTGRIYDVGEFNAHMRQAMAVADWDGFTVRQKQSAEQGKVRGIGLATYVEACAFAGSEPAHMRLNEDGTVTILIGTQSSGQGHKTAYAQFAAEILNMDIDLIDVRQGDTNELVKGGGTGGSRSIPLGGVSVNRASKELAEKIKAIASEKLEVATVDLELIGGEVVVVGTDQKMDFAAIAASAASLEDVSAIGEFKQNEATYPNGTHVCELEIERDTGVVEILNYTIVDDFGVTVNPLLLAGQVHGGVVQGIGQALYERTVYDEEGQLLSASLLDYTLPRADDVPDFNFETRNVPSTTNAMGIKGAGEAGSIGSCPAVMNAVMNAVQSVSDVRHIDMPALPETLWKAMN